MRERISSWLAPPAEDSDLARRQRLLNLVLLGLAGPGFLFGLVMTVMWALGRAPITGALSGLGVQPFYLLAYRLGRRGRVRLAAYVPVTILFLVMTGSSYQLGIGHVALIGYAMTTLTAGILIGTGAALFFTLLSTVAYMVVGLAQAAGRLSGVLPPETTVIADAAGLGLGLVVLVIFNWLSSREMSRALHQERELSAELKTHRRTLEQQVAERTRDLEQRSVQQQAAAQIAREAAAIRDVGQLVHTAVRLISDRFGFYHVGIFLLDDMEEYVVLQAASSEGGRRMLARGHKLAVGEVGSVGYAAGKGKPRIALDVGEGAVSFDNPDLPDTRSELALPLIVRGKVIGVLDVRSTEPQAFSDEDVPVFQTMADQVALALENARLLVEAQDRLRETDVLLGRQSRKGWEQLAAERPAWGYVYDGVQVLPREALRMAGVEDTEPRLTLPFQVRDEAIGYLDLVLADRSPTSEEISLAQAVVEQASMALENARLFQQTQRAVAETEALYRASRAIGAASSAAEVGQALVDYAAEGSVDVVRVLLFEHDEQGRPAYMVMREGWTVDDRPAQPYDTRLSLEDYPLANLLDPKEPIIVKDVLTDERANEMTRTLIATISGLRSFAMVPITVGERWSGMLFIGRNEPSAFSEELIRGCWTLSGQAAIALESMRLFEQTRRRAERERLLAEISAQVRASTDVDTILRTAVRELGRALRASDGLIRLRAGDDDDYETLEIQRQSER